MIDRMGFYVNGTTPQDIFDLINMSPEEYYGPHYYDEEHKTNVPIYRGSPNISRRLGCR